jgi:hypothetical protein
MSASSADLALGPFSPATIERSGSNTDLKLRLGITLWLLSWVPYGLILGLSGAWFTVAWIGEIILGVTGLAIAGAEFAEAVKLRGWKGAPAVAWHTMLHGREIGADD